MTKKSVRARKRDRKNHMKAYAQSGNGKVGYASRARRQKGRENGDQFQ